MSATSTRAALALAPCLLLACLSACTASPYGAANRQVPATEPVPLSRPALETERAAGNAPAPASRGSIPDLPQLPPHGSSAPGHAPTTGLDLPALGGGQAEPAHTPHFGNDPLGRTQAALYDLEHRANLDSQQQAKIHQARAALAAGHIQAAAKTATALDEKVRAAVRKYETRPGDTLNLIAERFYDNAHLWPLIWQENRKLIADPRQLHAGISLTFHLHPTLDRAAAALAYARRHAQNRAEEPPPT